MLLIMLMTNVYVSIIWDLIFFASGVQALRKLTYINLMVLEILENEVLDLLYLSPGSVGGLSPNKNNRHHLSDRRK